jgi:hypothetical protein
MNARERLAAIESQHAERMNAWIASLREVPFDHACGNEELRVIETLGGYYSVEITRAPDGHKQAHATTNGWDDISESGDFAHVMCISCYGRWRLPDDFDWN